MTGCNDISVDREWATSLNGLRMKVEDRWWDGYTGTTLHPGKILDVDFTNDNAKFFVLQLDDDEFTYEMRCDAVLKYADEDDANFHKYHLPEGLLEDPEGEEVVAPPQRRGRRRQRSSTRRTNRTIRIINNSTSHTSTDISDNSENPASSSEDEQSDDEQNNTIYSRTDPSEWKKIGGRTRAHTIEPIPFTGDNEKFTINITDDELKCLKDASGDIRFESVFEWLLPTFGEDDDEISFFEFIVIAARMRNYMIFIQRCKEFKPRYYDPSKCNTIQADHVAHFYGCHMARMLRGFPSIEETWCTREALDAIGPVKESMPKDAYIDLYRCMHFSDDDWDEEDSEVPWENVYADKKYQPSPEVERHRRKYEHIEDGFNRRWKECVNFGRWITADESRVAGWYKSGITIGPEPKPIRTGATIHSICVTHGDLKTFRLHCRVYGGKHDEGLNHVHHNTANTQKWVNLYDEMLEEFKGRGMCMTMDSAYMGGVMGQIGREVWAMNFVGTCQADRTGADVKETRKNMTVGTYESHMFQHRTKHLSFTMWSDNNIVKTLSNFHTPEVLVAAEGVLWRRRVDGLREQERTEVSCPKQQKDYNETFHLIDKGNGKESKYDMGGQTKGHNWAPKLHMQFWNFGLGNSSHTIYDAFGQTAYSRTLEYDNA
ncbi:hypothetical protein ACHAXR_006945 [Thalassiosira sp. AJA248-18]